MKKIFAFTFMVGVLWIVSCSKQSTQETNFTSTTNGRLRADLEKINVQFAQSKHIKFPYQNVTLAQMTNGQKAVLTGCADLTAVVASGTATWSWHAVAPPWGSLAAGFVAGLAGTAASYGAWNTFAMPVLSSDEEAEVVTRITSHEDDYWVPNPHTNPWEHVGIRHNQLLKLLFQKDTVPVYSPGRMLFTDVDLQDGEIEALDYGYPNTKAYELYSYFFRQNAMKDSQTLEYTVQPYLDFSLSGSGNQNLHTIFTIFMQGLPTDNLQILFSYVNKYEEYFLADETLSDWERQSVLMGLATAKHSYAFWYHAFDI